MSTADTTDVDPGLISTDLDESVIQGYLDDVVFEAQQAIEDYDSWDSERKKQLEKYATALKIRLYRDRAIDMGMRESAQISYEGMSTEELRREVDKRDPSGELATNRDTDRYVGST